MLSVLFVMIDLCFIQWCYVVSQRSPACFFSSLRWNTFHLRQFRSGSCVSIWNGYSLIRLMHFLIFFGVIYANFVNAIFLWWCHGHVRILKSLPRYLFSLRIRYYSLITNLLRLKVSSGKDGFKSRMILCTSTAYLCTKSCAWVIAGVFTEVKMVSN